MAFTPLHDRVLVRRIEGEEKTAGGLSSQNQLKKNQQKVKSSLQVKAHAKTAANLSQWLLKLATKFCSANGPAQKLRSTAKTC